MSLVCRFAWLKTWSKYMEVCPRKLRLHTTVEKNNCFTDLKT